MDSFTLNKIAGAVLGTCLIGMGIGIVAQGIYTPDIPKKPGFALPQPSPEAATAGGEKKPTVVPLPVLLAKADPKKGEADAKVCAACHNFAEGAGTKVGPDLYGVVDREKGSVPGFDYSAGVKKKGGKWTYADLDDWLTDPAKYIPGTKMGYAGEANPEKRADIISYLRTLSKSPVPLPPVTEADKKAEAGGEKQASAEGGAKPAATGGSSGGDDAFVKMVAAADPKKGQSDAQVCSACHNFKKGAGTLVGPDLWGVVDRPKGSEPGFDYSAGLKAKGGKWTYADLNEWLTNPAKYIPGTKMGFAGEASEKKRAEIVAFLRTLADTPAPLPGAGGDKPPAAEKPASPAIKPESQKPPPPPNKPGAAEAAKQSPDEQVKPPPPAKADAAPPAPAPTNDKGPQPPSAPDPSDAK